MTGTRRKQVSQLVMEQVRLALQQMAGDPAMPRTKRQVEKLTGLSHDAVARAFRHDAEMPKKVYRLTELFEALQAPDADPSVAKPGPTRQQVANLRSKLADKHSALDRFATALLTREMRDGAEGATIAELPRR